MAYSASHKSVGKPATAASVRTAMSKGASVPSCNVFPLRESDFLTLYTPYIQNLLRKKASPGLEEDINDVTQEVLFTIWRKMMPGQDEIESLDAYVCSIVNSRWIDAARKRQRQPTLPLLEEDGEPSQGVARRFSDESTGDPALEYERKELIEEVIYEVTRLPLIQMKAMICMLRDEIENIFPLSEAFMKYRVDIRSIVWPDDSRERQSWLSSLSVARKKLRHTLKQRYTLV